MTARMAAGCGVLPILPRMLLKRMALVMLLAACRTEPDGPSAEQLAIARAALGRVFIEREHAQGITLWMDTAALALADVRTDDALPALRITPEQLAIRVPTLAATRAGMDSFFLAHPSGWDAWFDAHHANAGIIEVATPQRRGSQATVVVTRTCGDHCRHAWRIWMGWLGGEWRVQQVEVLPVHDRAPS